MASLKLVCVVLVCMVITTPMTTQAITCGQVSGKLAPCVNFLKTGGPVPGDCCSGVKAINDAAQTTPDRQAACQCLKNAASSISGINPGNAASLPSACGVNVGYPISTSVDCKSVK
ncbi:hypothetical protein K2173_008156 [Erythroxylum novogranatense]|uniref:Non-specific lipid-transfer protein n=1 Tax=Erythroxylum novogranatense TaxID=1862640 RepID=A0AAV8UBY1_9ROSI|nr:hypothetical protein K2173_008156 [Erythroxylum novogranatense]